jgi:hypothetical protein
MNPANHLADGQRLLDKSIKLDGLARSVQVPTKPLEPHDHALRHQPQVHRSDRADENQHGQQPPTTGAGAANQLPSAPMANDLYRQPEPEHHQCRL